MISGWLILLRWLGAASLTTLHGERQSQDPGASCNQFGAPQWRRNEAVARRCRRAFRQDNDEP
jgi:hypothetical protein